MVKVKTGAKVMTIEPASECLEPEGWTYVQSRKSNVQTIEPSEDALSMESEFYGRWSLPDYRRDSFEDYCEDGRVVWVERVSVNPKRCYSDG
jgi:hypothetical protein